jgi:gluconolactonase
VVNAKEQIVASGFTFPEGPSVDRNGIVYLAELPRGCVSKVVDGKRVVVADLGDSPNGTAFGPDGNLYVCNGGGNWPPTPSTNGIAGWGGGTPSIQVVRPDGSHATALAEIGGVRLNGPNDICFDAKGGYYFSDPAWAKRTTEGVAPAENSPPGDICYVARNGLASRVAGDMLFPNGLHVTPDCESLIVAETGTGRVLAFSIDDDGGLRDRRVLVDLGLQSGLDGMCFDSEGRLLIAGCGSGSIYVLAPGLTRLEETVALSDPTVTNLCFGGEDFQTIFVTEGSAGRLAALRWRVPGMRLFPDRHT